MRIEAIINNFLLSFILLLGTASVASCQKKSIPEPLRPDNIFIDNGIIKLGVDLTLGGAITFISDSKKKENLINNYDWGRQIQMSFYGGPNPFTPNGKEPSANWKFLGWNPIQSGDYAGNRAKVMDYSSTPTSIYIKSIPMQWPLNNEPCDCYFESRIFISTNTVKIKNTIVNQRVDTQQYKGRSQELPAVYTNAKWNKLITYRGLAPFTNDTLSHIRKLLDNYAWEDWQATENWAANVDSSNWGLGIWNEGTQQFKGGFAGKWGDKGGEKDFPTAYIAPIQQEILDHNINYSYEFTLILGTVNEIRNYVYAHSKKNPLPSYKFISNRQSWKYENSTDAGWPINNFLQVYLSDKTALLSPVALWDAAKAPQLNIEAAYSYGSATTAKIYWKQYGQDIFTEQNSVEFPVVADGNFRNYQIPLGTKAGYSGMIKSLKFAPSVQPPPNNSWVKIKSVSF